MSGLRAIILVCLTAFFLGTLCTHWTADSLTMWNPPLTPEHLAAAAVYYKNLASIAPSMLYVLAGLAAAGLLVLLTNFWDPREASLFDWASLFLYGFSGFIYLYSVIPSILRFASYAPPSGPSSTDFPLALRAPLLELASSHLFCSVALTGVIFLQGGRWWAEGEDETWDRGAEERRRLLKGKGRGGDGAEGHGKGGAHAGKRRSGRRRKGLLRGLRGGGSQ
ncbi:hypothetical protein CALCODRAFT_492411 [Calocera cornea HHB12733]|uniref:Shr3 amino acid permease chaperone n=1 Tax=Calocera cornea HHB12733 TaxID=1353952 RepID=A0A165IBU9_9BASI|nr:hypothetical protein CALCODRAFT_492411 [Calocera cornea HHB12733]